MNETLPETGSRHVGPPRDPVFAVIEPALKAGVACGMFVSTSSETIVVQPDIYRSHAKVHC